MTKPIKPLEFDWDQGNIEKNWRKHQVNFKECEEAFVNQPTIIYLDTKHSTQEKRFIILGKTNRSRKLHIAFTIRKEKVRVISARDQNNKERQKYAQESN